METINTFITKHGMKLVLLFTALTFINTCGNPNKATNKRIDALTVQVDSLKKMVATKVDLQIEGLKAEKRMIQSTDRKIMDVNRQSEIDKEIQALESK
jgi:hypothetical protein